MCSECADEDEGGDETKNGRSNKEQEVKKEWKVWKQERKEDQGHIAKRDQK